jgi:hypothetical protein
VAKLNNESQWQIDTNIEIDEASVKAAAQQALDDTHRELITLRNLLIGLIYLSLAAVNFLAFNSDVAPTISIAAAVTGLLFVSAFYFHKRGVYPSYLSNWFLFGEVVVLQLDGMLFLVSTSDAMSSYGVYVTIIGIGFFVSRLKWLVIAIAFLIVSWMAVLTAFQFAFEVQTEGMLLLSTVTTAFFFYYLRVRLAQRQARSKLVQDAYCEKLEYAVTQIRTLEGLLPICASCKAIRDHNGMWQRIEAYVEERADVEFTHSVCPGCTDKLYPQLAK